jgi:hypothetical protein
MRYKGHFYELKRINVSLMEDMGGFELALIGVLQIESKFIFFKKCENRG